MELLKVAGVILATVFIVHLWPVPVPWALLAGCALALLYLP